jgi:hypothetical protein
MRLWDLNTGAAKLELGMDSLQKAAAEVGTRWDDEAFRGFQSDYLEPLEPRIRRALDAIHRLAEVLARAERECSAY